MHEYRQSTTAIPNSRSRVELEQSGLLKPVLFRQQILGKSLSFKSVSTQNAHRTFCPHLYKSELRRLVCISASGATATAHSCGKSGRKMFTHSVVRI